MNPESEVEALLKATKLKAEERTGWGLRGVEEPESVADHSWGTALLVLLYADEEGVDRAEALEMAVSHDLPEAITGDLLPPEHPSGSREGEKLEAESEAADRLSEEGLDRAVEHWRKYEEGGAPEAVFVKDMDLCDMALQALIYLRQGEASGEELKEFLVTAEEGVDTETGRRLVSRIVAAFDSTTL